MIRTPSLRCELDGHYWALKISQPDHSIIVHRAGCRRQGSLQSSRMACPLAIQGPWVRRPIQHPREISSELDRPTRRKAARGAIPYALAGRRTISRLSDVVPLICRLEAAHALLMR